MSVTPLKKQQLIGEDVLERIEELIKLARDGEIVDILVVVDHAKDGYERISDFQDRLKALGALEYLKDSIHKAG